MTTLLNHVSMAAAAGKRIFTVTGHGTGLGVGPRIPPGTYVIFLSKPGQILNANSTIRGTRLYEQLYIRSVLMGGLRSRNVRPVRLAYWKKHVYGPGDLLPEMTIEFKDINPALNNLFGVLNTSMPGARLNVHRKSLLSQTIRRHGRGIYVVVSCRSSQLRHITGMANINYRSNVARTGGTQRGLRVGSMSPNVNKITQYKENIQRRLAKSKRNASHISPRTTPAKKSRLRLFSFHPGVPSPPKKRRSTTSRRLATPRSTR